MPDYRRRLLIDAGVLPGIRAAGQRILLGREVNRGRLPSVIWLSLDPLERIEVQWNEHYGIYASMTAIEHGARITKLAETGIPAQAGASYTLTAAATFSGPFFGSGVPRDCYAAQNDLPFTSHRELTFGLTQSALVNQTPVTQQPVSAMRVLSGRVGDMWPVGIIHIWLQAALPGGTIITASLGTKRVANFGGNTTALTLKYIPEFGGFMQHQV